MAYQLVVVGTSLGGFEALTVLLGGLPANFPLPLAVVQHRGSSVEEPSSGVDLPLLLQRHAELTIADAEDKDALLPGRVYLAPVGYHLLVEEGSVALSTDRPVWHARPSIDVLFESAADVYGAATIGLALTGSSQDGAAGLARIKRQGGLAIVQQPATSASRVLPDAALKGTEVDWTVPLGEIAPLLRRLLGSPASESPTGL